MKRIYLKNVKKFTLVSDEDFNKVKTYSWHLDKSNGYVRCNFKKRISSNNYLRRKLYLHHLVLSPKGGLQIDHINCNPLDNRRENLRLVDESTNIHNRRKARIDSKIGVRNIHRQRNGTFSVFFKRKGVETRIGTFKTLRSAVIARNAKLRSMIE